MRACESLKRAPPTSGVVTTPPHDFAAVFKSFCSNNFMTESEGIVAALNVRGECIRIAHYRAFRTSHTQAVTCDAFQAVQKEALEDIVQSVKEDWPQKTGMCAGTTCMQHWGRAPTE